MRKKDRSRIVAVIRETGLAHRKQYVVSIATRGDSLGDSGRKNECGD